MKDGLFKLSSDPADSATHAVVIIHKLEDGDTTRMTTETGKDTEALALEDSTLSLDPPYFAVLKMVPNAHTAKVAVVLHGHTALEEDLTLVTGVHILSDQIHAMVVGKKHWKNSQSAAQIEFNASSAVVIAEVNTDK